MRIYVNSDTGRLINGFSFPEALSDNRIELKRGDSAVLDFYFGKAFATAGADLGTVTSFKFGAKVAGDYDGSYVVSNYSGGTFVFTETVSGSDTFYRVAPGWNTNKLNNLLGNDPEGFAEVTEVRTVADVASSLTGKFFKISDDAGTVGVWIDVGNAGATIPAGAAACTRAIEITTINANDSAGDVATKIAAVLEADSKFTAAASGSLVTITDASTGSRTAATAETSTFSVARWITGSAPNTMANVASVDLDAEVEYIVGGNVTSTSTFTARVTSDINRGSEGVPVNANPAYPSPAQLPLFRLDITNETGGTSSDLDSIVTIGIDLATYPTLYLVKTAASQGIQGWQLVSGTDAENVANGIVRPDDFNASTNAKVWKLQF